MTIREMTEAAATLYDLLQSGEIDESTFNDNLNEIGAEEKIDTYCTIISQLNADTLAIDSEIKRLKARKAIAEKSVSRMKEALISFMAATNQSKTKTKFYSVSCREVEHVNVFDFAALPEQYKKYADPVPDKNAIKSAIKSGKDVAGASLEPTKSLLIK